MKPFLPVGELARDDRFHTVTMQERASDPRGSARQAATEQSRRSSNRLTPSRKDATDAARALMHGILVGEVQALEGAGRTCFDFETTRTTSGSTSADAVPFDLKLDMARQCWDEARHVEISAHLSTWMGTGIGDYAENTVLFEAACSRDPVLRLAGVNRALEGLAIDVFTTMKEFGDIAGDPVLEFCEDWMLADEVTHVKMGSDWLRRLTATDPDRRKAALEFQQVVDKLFSSAGARSDSDESAIGLARRFRELAGFSQDEIDEIAAVSAVALDEAKEHRRQERDEAVAALADATLADAALTTERAARSMAVTVSPAEFTFVQFDAAVIRAAVEELLDRLGMADRDLRLEVDESSPIARVQVEAGDPLVVVAESGAFEDTRKPRQLSALAVATACGRMLLRTRDRETSFSDAPADDALTLPQVAAWDAYSIGRLGRLGYEVNRQRWLYNFRNRHGFTDAGDRTFEALWTADGLSWAELSTASDAALSARQTA